jgi:GT2 family glycosyltransferase
MISPAVSIVVVNWNAREFLRDCIRSIRENVSVAVQIIVVDNASRDGSAAMVRSEFPDVELIANTENRGFAAANNQGIRIANAPYILLLNPDTIVYAGALENSVAYMNARPDVGLMGCRVMETQDRIQRTCFSFPGPVNLLLIQSGLHRVFPRSRVFGRPELGWWDRDSELDVPVVSGMYMLARRDVIDKVGLMDEDYFVYAEEADWCFRIRKAGWRCVFAPVGQILHRDGGGKSTAQTKARMYVQLQKSILIFNRKNLGAGAYCAAKTVYVGSMLARWVAWSAMRLLTNKEDATALARLAAASLRYHLLGVEPKS